jgi:hypothetical protein
MIGLRIKHGGRSEDKSYRTAGMRLKTDPKLQVVPLPIIPRLLRAAGRIFA